MTASEYLGVGAASLAAHAAFLAALAWIVAHGPLHQQPMPEARLDIAAYEVDRTAAVQDTPQAEDVAEGAASGASAVQGDIPVFRADAKPLKAQTTVAAIPKADRVAAAISGVSLQAALTTPSESLTASASRATALAEVSVGDAAPERPATGTLLALVQPAATALAEVSAGDAAPERPATGTPLALVQPAATALAEVSAGDAAPERPTTGTPLALVQPAATALADRAPSAATAAPAVSPVSERGTAELAWSGAGGTVDPVSLAAIQAFMQPGDLASSDANLGQLRDGIATLLASVPCARLQTRFIPETGTLELRGHIPENALRGPVLAALQAQIGGAIRVSDQLLILPRPQCGALAGIAAVGLPQSTDQLTNPRVVGPDAHVREYRYAAGQRLTFDLTAPDYDSVIYVDYFDAEGMVIHLQPNDIVPLTPILAKNPVTVGQERNGIPSLNITIAPPFGQEIAVAFAASAPLYDGLRPIREPAEPYLAFLRDRVAAARAAYPDFKGEWVYFFMTTTAQ